MKVQNAALSPATQLAMPQKIDRKWGSEVFNVVALGSAYPATNTKIICINF